MPDSITRLSWKEIYPILKGWTDLVRIERHVEVYDGIITAILQDIGAVEFSAMLPGEGRKTMLLEVAAADFERFTYPGEWEEVLMVFPPVADEWFTLRKWKSKPTSVV
jgi:hypothetical protein